MDSADSLKLGIRVRVNGKLTRLEQDRNPGQFDFRQYCLAKGICGSLKGKDVQIVDSRYLWVQEKLRQLGLVLERRLELIADEEDMGLLKAILLGEKGDMDDAVYKLYQKNGISHVLAISGLHVSVIGMGIWNGLRKLGAGYWSAGVAAFGMLFCFGSIAGFGPSVVRAVFMMGISFLAGAFGRTYDLPSAMAVPAMGLLLRNPFVLTQTSFQLSFLAVFAIFFPGTYLAKQWRLSGFWQNLWTSLSIQFVTLPVILYHSFEVPVYGVLLNLVVVPLMTYVLVSGILGLGASFVWMPLGPFLLGGAHYILSFYKMACRYVGDVTGAYLILGRPSFGAMAVYYGCLAGATFLGWKIMGNSRVLKRKLLCSIFSFTLLWSAGAFALMPVLPSGLEVTFLDVGQGDGIVIRSENKTILVDGGSSQEKNLGENCLIPFIKSQGISCLDAMVVTHGDQDHISGVRELLEQRESGIEVKRLLLPSSGAGDQACVQLAELAKARGIDVFFLDREGIWNWTGAGLQQQCMEKGVGIGSAEIFWQNILGKEVNISCLHPSVEKIGIGGTEEADADRNNGSLVLLLEYQSFQLLLTGDVELQGEQEILARGLDSPVTVLKAAHHGSASSSGEEFLNVVRPAYVVFSYGKGNRYGHPSDSVVERCERIGAEIWKTAEHGAIRIRTNGEKMQIRGWLDRHGGI